MDINTGGIKMKYNPKYLENRIQHTIELIEILYKEKLISFTKYSINNDRPTVSAV